MTDLEAKLTDVLQARLPGVETLVSCDRLSGGASQETYRIIIRQNGQPRTLALRRSPGGTQLQAAIGPATEAAIFRTTRAAGVPGPEIFHVLAEADGVGDGFLMEWIEGEALGARIVRNEEFAAIRPRLARQFGEVAARIHAIDVEATGLASLLTRKTPEGYVGELWSHYRAMESPQPMIDYTARWLLDHLPSPHEPRLVHNDFRNGNLMISPERGVVAVLDWETAHIGAPIRDLGWVCTNSWRYGSELPVGGFGEIEDLLAGYESVSGTAVTRDDLHFWIVFGSFWWAVQTLSMTGIYRSGPDRSVERAAIGRRTSECQVDCVNLLIPGPAELPEATADSSLDVPTARELVESIRDFLRGDVMSQTHGRTRFLARVAANTLDIVLRELALGERHRERDREGLERILATTGDLANLRWKLVNALRDGSMPLDSPGLADHLRRTVITQAAIDQPHYSGYQTAIGTP